MDGRMRLAVGGAATVVASVAVVCAVVVSNAAALADTAGRPLAFAQIDVPMSATASASPRPSVVTPVTTAGLSPETLPAPDPVDVATDTQMTSPLQADSTVQSDAPAQRPPSDSTVSPSDLEAQARREFAGAVSASTWDRLVAWAHSNGWSESDLVTWLADNKGRLSEWKALVQASQTPADDAGSPSLGDLWSRDGSKKDQSPSTPSGRD